MLGPGARARSRTSTGVVLLAGLLVLGAGDPVAGAISMVGDRNSPSSPERNPPVGAAQETASVPDEAELDRRVTEVASKLRCPVCRNQSVLESSSDLARRMQGVIRERLAAGETPEEVQAYFVSRYGDWILLQPEPEGINLLVYLLPAVALLAGIVVVTIALRRWVSAPDDGRTS